MRKAPEKNSGQATGVAAASGTAHATNDGHIVRVHSHLCVEPAQDDEEHIARRNGKAEFRSQEPGARSQETRDRGTPENGKGHPYFTTETLRAQSEGSGEGGTGSSVKRERSTFRYSSTSRAISISCGYSIWGIQLPRPQTFKGFSARVWAEIDPNTER
jgi:hypothetical protein